MTCIDIEIMVPMGSFPESYDHATVLRHFVVRHHIAHYIVHCTSYYLSQ